MLKAKQNRGRAARTPIADIMTKEVVTVLGDLPVAELTRMFLDRGLHGAPVLGRGGDLIGFVSMSDLVRQRYEDEGTGETELRVHTRTGAEYDLGPGFHEDTRGHACVNEVMTPLPIGLKADAPIQVAAALMAFEGVHRIPVLSADGHHVIGVLSAIDVLRWLANQPGPYAPAVPREMVVRAGSAS
jgi:CBS domain-containing protein